MVILKLLSKVDSPVPAILDELKLAPLTVQAAIQSHLTSQEYLISYFTLSTQPSLTYLSASSINFKTLLFAFHHTLYHFFLSCTIPLF